jgi:4-amino-4-deoxy-L-arabinose transferase-like glycosyltransferase
MALFAPGWIRVKNLKQHTPFLFVLLFHLTLALLYASLIPLGEAPDESAHLGYARFIARHGRLPATLAERQQADYRSDFPPLYYLIIARPLAVVGDTPPAQLKSVGDTPRRLIPTNGQTIAAFIHTADEAWPWRGITLGWHLSRFVSVIFTVLSIILTYAIAWRLTGQRKIALSAAALHAFIPQVLFIGSVLNEDSLLTFLSGLLLLALISYTKPPRLPGLWHTFLLGILLGLASVSKYNALPLWPLVGMWGVWLVYKKSKRKADSLLPTLKRLAQHSVALLIGVILTAGWWLGFVWFHFNEVDNLGLIRGSLAAFTSSTHDTTLQKVAAGMDPHHLQILLGSLWRRWRNRTTCLGLLAPRYLLSSVAYSSPPLRITYHLSRITLHVPRYTPYASRNPFHPSLRPTPYALRPFLPHPPLLSFPPHSPVCHDRGQYRRKRPGASHLPHPVRHHHGPDLGLVPYHPICATPNAPRPSPGNHPSRLHPFPQPLHTPPHPIQLPTAHPALHDP